MLPHGARRVRYRRQNGLMPDPPHTGDEAIIMSGPFEGKVGTVAAIDGDVASVTVDVFARETPVQVPLAELVVQPGET